MKRIICLVALVATLSACDSKGAPTPTATPRPLQSGVQPAAQLPQHCTDPEGPALPQSCIDQARAAGLVACPEEDGNPNGVPCLWADPGGTGIYYVDSREYRD